MAEDAARAATSGASPRARDRSPSSGRRGRRQARGNSSRRPPPTAAADTVGVAASHGAISIPTGMTTTTTSTPQANGKAPRSRAKKPSAASNVLATSAAAAAAPPRQLTPIESLVLAIHSNDLAAFRTVLAAHADLDVSKQLTPDGDAALVEACRYARHDMVATLLRDQRASLNVAATNKRANRHGLTPLAAACMTLDAALVDLLLQADAESPSDVLVTGRVNAVALCALMSVANGYTETQATNASALLEKLLAHAQATDKLADVLALEMERGNRVVHVAASAANWRTLAVLRAVGADVNVANRLGQTPLGQVELNAFDRRNTALGTPFQSNGGSKRQQKGNRSHGKQSKADERDVIANEPVSAAAMPTPAATKVAKQVVESTEVVSTYIELAKTLGFACMFSRKGDAAVAFPMRCLVLTHVGFVQLANEFARLSDESTVVAIEGLVYTIMAMHSAQSKRTKDSAVLWQHSLTGKPATDGATDSSTKEGETKTIALTPAAFELILDDIFASHSLSRRVLTMAMVLTQLEGLYAESAVPGRGTSPNQPHLRALSLYERIGERIYHSGVKTLFGIFDRTAAEEGDCYDEEIEFHLLLALAELFFQCFAPFAHEIVDTSAAGETPTHVPAAVAFERATAQIKQLWPLLEAGMRGIDDSVSSPQRFSLVLHVVQVFAQVESSLRANEPATVAKLYRTLKQFVRSEAKKKRPDRSIASRVSLLQTLGRALPLPQSFADRIAPLADKLDILIRSDPKIVGVDLYAIAPLPNIVRLEHKVDYLGVLAEEQHGSVSVSINRASASNHVDFILQQVLSTSARNLRGELNITLINEPGVGAGVIREFFQIVQQCFFSPSFTMHRSAAGSAASDPVAPHVAEIGASWLHLARAESSSPSRSRQDAPAASADRLAEHFPLFEYIDRARSDEVRIPARPLQVKRSVLDAKRGSDALSLRPDDLVTDPQVLDARKKLYQCVGRLLGLAIRNYQPLGVTFPLALWKFLMHDHVAWHEYCGANDVFQRSLAFVVAHDFDASPLEMHFEYTTDVVVVDDASDWLAGAASPAAAAKTTVEMPLKPGRHAPVAVTNANKLEYVELRAKQHFFGHELALYQKLRDGLLETLASADLRLFRAEELQRIARGERVIDLSVLKQSVLYLPAASLEYGVIKMFWDVVGTFDQAAREQLLTFWSGSPQPPLFGFASTPRAMSSDAAMWYIEVDPRMKTSHCPMANTCDRRLILPDYPSAAVLKEKLMVALRLGAVGYDRM